MSKKRADRALGPFSSTSSHRRLRSPATHMWFGTRSSKSPMLRVRSSSVSARNASSPPSSGFTASWLATS